MRSSIWVLTDLDGVIMGRSREKDGERDQVCHYAKLLRVLENSSYDMAFVTDRGVAQLAPLAYLLNASRYHAGESGAVVYDAFEHTIIIHPEFQKTADKINQTRELFRQEFGNEYPLEPGVITSLRVERVNGRNLNQVTSYLAGFTRNGSGLICADHGDCVSLKPVRLDKKIGLCWLERLYRHAGKSIDYSRSVWLGDGKSDIPAADHIYEHGGRIAGVANSHPDYRRFIEERGGYISAHKFTLGAADILENFLK